jgi:hypothetical protein
VRRSPTERRSRLRRRAGPTPPPGPTGENGAAPDLRQSLESTLRGLRKLLASLEGSGFKEAVGPYADMHLVLVQQRLWSRNQGRDDLEALWAEIAEAAGGVHEILSRFDAVMSELAGIDKVEPAAGPAPEADAGLELARLFGEGAAVSGAALRARLSWPDEVRRRALARLVAEGVLERRGWGRSLSYRLAGSARERVADELAALLVGTRSSEA